MINGRNHISEMIRANSKDTSKTALQLYNGGKLTYGELIGFQIQAQSAIQRFSILPSARIALISSNNILYPSLLLAIMEEATCVPLDYDLSFEDYEKYYQLLSVDYLMCDRTDGPACAAAMAAGLGIIEFYPDNQDNPAFLQFIRAQEATIEYGQTRKNDQTAYIFTTSGTTSLPKVVPKLYYDIFSVLPIEAKNMEFAEDSLHLVATPMFRFPTIWIMLKVLMTNGRIIHLDGLNPKRITETILDSAITHAYLPPAGLVSLHDYAQDSAISYQADHIMNIVVYGAPLPYKVKDRIEKCFNANLIDVYGMTEIGITTSTHQAPLGYKEGSVGYPLAQQIKIVDDEILVKGVGVFKGYENNPQVNQDSFIDGWFRTGDVGYVDKDGYLYIQSRVREMINRGGEKISPFEIEEAVLSLGNIKEVCIFPYPNRQGSDEVGAVIVPTVGATIGLRDLRNALKDRIRPYKLPTLLFTIDEIPRSSASKVQRQMLFQQLQDLGLAPQTLKNGGGEPLDDTSPTQLKIIEIWKQILHQDHIGLDSVFFDLGGDSLSAAEVLAAIEANLGCVLPVNEFFRQSTVRELAQLVEATQKFNPYKHIVPLRAGGDKPPIFFIHDFSGDNVTYHLVTEYINPERPIYGLNFNWQKEGWNTATTINELAQAYLEEVQQVKQDSPYYLVGLSIGGQIAYAMGSILAKRKREAVVFMIDTYSEKALRNSQVNRRFQELLKKNISNFRQEPIQRLPGLAIKKAATLYNEFILAEMKLQKPANDNSPVREEIPGTDGITNRILLNAIRKNFRPAKFPGKVCYFRALGKNGDINRISYLHWRELAQDFTMFERECDHVDFVKPDYAAYTAGKINDFLETYEKPPGNGSS